MSFSLNRVVRRAKEILDPAKLPLPERPVVREIRVLPYQDHTGADALEVWVILDESTTRADRTVDNVQAIRQAVSDTLLADEIEEFPYIHLATLAELEEVGLKI
jgi:hypothetical protein